MRHLTIEGSYNVRDLGGLVTHDGYTTRWQTLIRAGNLDKVSAAGCQYVMDYGVRTVIDLRDEWEIEAYPNVFASVSGIHYANIPLIGDRYSQDEAWTTASEGYTHLHELYAYYLDNCQPQIAAIVRALTASSGGTIFHCYAGKDRTGLIAALVLGSVGTAEDAIAEDYSQTGDQIVSLVTEWRAYAAAREYDMAKFEQDVSAAPQTMLDTLRYLTTRYGGVVPYLLSSGVTEAELTSLRQRLVAIDE
ncbi:MAG: tyrosine-protein phosphatase [Chloroflexi bacterium]|nr:tyrosine-protein phosphatase [Chloroflexota bacterium]MCC6893380.1 tyrosine-protein phosphatase [Anaerolineae bacterium]